MQGTNNFSIFKNTFMKKIFQKYFLILGAVIFVSSCTKDKTWYEINQATAPSSGTTLVSSTTNVQGMSLSTQSDTAVNFSWGSVWYGTKTPVTYTLQYDSVGKGFSNPSSYSFGQDIFQGSITQANLNLFGVNAGIPKGSTGTLEFRIMTSIGSEGQMPVYSNVVNITFNTYLPKVYMYIPGDYQGWSPSTAPELLSTDADNFSGFVYVPSASGATYQFKITNYPDWNHTSYGDGGSGKLSSSGGNLIWPNGGGFYQLNATLSTLTWSATLYTFTVAGDFNGWSTSATPMTYNTSTNSWTYTGTFTAGGFKIVGNGGTWCGGDGSTNTLYWNSGGNISISAGTHTISANFSTPGAYTYTIQ